MSPSERNFLVKAIVRNIYPNVTEDDIVIEPYRLLSNGFAQVRVSPNIHSAAFFAERDVSYERFKLNDYKPKSTDPHLSVPAIRATNPQELVNYMNEVYLNSVNVRERTQVYDIFRGFQWTLALSQLQEFSLSNPLPDDTLLIRYKDNSYIFTGYLRIKFV